MITATLTLGSIAAKCSGPIEDKAQPTASPDTTCSACKPSEFFTGVCQSTPVPIKFDADPLDRPSTLSPETQQGIKTHLWTVLEEVNSCLFYETEVSFVPELLDHNGKPRDASGIAHPVFTSGCKKLWPAEAGAESINIEVAEIGMVNSTSSYFGPDYPQTWAGVALHELGHGIQLQSCEAGFVNVSWEDNCITRKQGQTSSDNIFRNNYNNCYEDFADTFRAFVYHPGYFRFRLKEGSEALKEKYGIFRDYYFGGFEFPDRPWDKVWIAYDLLKLYDQPEEAFALAFQYNVGDEKNVYSQDPVNSRLAKIFSAGVTTATALGLVAQYDNDSSPLRRFMPKVHAFLAFDSWVEDKDNCANEALHALDSYPEYFGAFPGRNIMEADFSQAAFLFINCQGNPDKAAVYVEEFHQKYPNNVGAVHLFNSLGFKYQNLDRPVEAILSYQKAIDWEFDSTDPNAVYYKIDYEIELKYKSDSQYQIGSCFEALGEPGKAKNAYQKTINEYPETEAAKKAQEALANLK